jgi:hypothetical protein
VFSFRGAYKPPAVASRIDRWVSKATGSCTIASVSGGSMDLALDATSEVQNASLDFGDILAYDIDDLIRIEFIMKVSASLAAAVSGAFRPAHGAERQPRLADEAHQLQVRRQSNAIVCESDDNGNYDLDDKATGFSLAATYRRFAIDFSSRSQNAEPPSLSKGGTADVRFWMSNDRGALGPAWPVASTSICRRSRAICSPTPRFRRRPARPSGTLSFLGGYVDYRLPC